MTRRATSWLVFLALLGVAGFVIASAAIDFNSPQGTWAALGTQPLSSSDLAGCGPLTCHARRPTPPSTATLTNTPPPTSRHVAQVLPTAVAPTRMLISQVLPVATPVVRALPRAGSGPEDGSFPWLGVLGGLLAASGVILVFSGLHGGLSDSER
jgi:hypothetical protein